MLNVISRNNTDNVFMEILIKIEKYISIYEMYLLIENIISAYNSYVLTIIDLYLTIEDGEKYLYFKS